MRDRLIELLNECQHAYDIEVGEAIMEKRKPIGENALYADHLLANGVVVLPCKVGDFVWAKAFWWRDFADIIVYQITNISITQNKKGEWTKRYRAMRFKDGKTFDMQLNFSFDDIGKTVFLTRELAEKALEERSENGT